MSAPAGAVAVHTRDRWQCVGAELPGQSGRRADSRLGRAGDQSRPRVYKLPAVGRSAGEDPGRHGPAAPSCGSVDFARGANLLVIHLAIAAGTTSPLHAAPAVVGRVAQSAGVGRLVLSHIGTFDLDAAVAEVRSTYSGLLTVGADLQCTLVP